jgi:hypothetical protein
MRLIDFQEGPFGSEDDGSLDVPRWPWVGAGAAQRSAAGGPRPACRAAIEAGRKNAESRPADHRSFARELWTTLCTTLWAFAETVDWRGLRRDAREISMWIAARPDGRRARPDLAHPQVADAVQAGRPKTVTT